MNTEKTLIENENQLSCLGAVSGSIHVTDGRTERYRQFHSLQNGLMNVNGFS
jgi:hypothetical protein